MVQITHTAVLDSKTGKKRVDANGKLILVSARLFDKETDGKKTCLCPDPNCMAILVHHAQHDKTFYDRFTGEAFQATIPNYFQRAPHAPQHDENCTAVTQYRFYHTQMRDSGFQEYGEGVVVVINNNIPTSDDKVMPRTRQSGLGHQFQKPSEGERGGTRKPPLSHGINNAHMLAVILDITHFEPERREAILMRRGTKTKPLSEYYQEKPEAMFRALHNAGRDNNGLDIENRAVFFNPIKSPQFHNPKEKTIEGMAQNMVGVDGRTYNMAFKLHAADMQMYKALKQTMRDGAKSFLIDSAKCWVEVEDSQTKFNQVAQGKPKGQTLFVHVYVGSKAQFTPWAPPSGTEADFGLAGLMPLPPAPKPPKSMCFTTMGQQRLGL